MSPQEPQVPWSSGTKPPRTPIPVQTVDCHMHIFESRFPVDPNARSYLTDATVAQYRLLQKRLGMTRNVLVQPSTYGTDNSGLIEIMAEFGTENARAVAVVNTSVSDEQLHELDRAG